jgi:hypothetical protein
MNFHEKHSLGRLFWLITFLFFTGRVNCMQAVRDFYLEFNGKWTIFNLSPWLPEPVHNLKLITGL